MSLSEMLNFSYYCLLV